MNRSLGENLNHSFNKTSSKGFTLIELVVVIVILGVLAAVAAPKFVDLKSDARSEALKKFAGDMRSLNELVHTKAIIANKSNVPGNAFFESNLGEINIYNGYLETIGEGDSRIGIFEMLGSDAISDFTLSREVGGCAYRRGGYGDLGAAGSGNRW